MSDCIKFYIFVMGFMVTQSLWAEPQLHHGSPVFPMAMTMEKIPLGRYMETLEDPSQALDIETLRNSPSLQARFVPVESEQPNWGPSFSAFWARFVVINDGPAAQVFIMENRYSQVDFFDVYMMLPDGGYRKFSAGDRQLPSTGTIFHRFPAFEMELPPGATTFYARVSSTGACNFSLYAWSPKEFAKTKSNEYLFLGLMLGALLIMALYNLFLYFSFLERAYLYYVCYTLSFVLFNISVSGLGRQYLEEALPYSWISNNGFIFGAELSDIFASLFAISFLNLREYLPKLRIALLGLCCLSLLSILSVQFFTYAVASRISFPNVILVSLSLMAGGLYCAWHRYKPAYFYVVAWMILLAGTVGLTLRSAGVLQENPFTNWGQLAGGVVEAALLSLALGYKIKLSRESSARRIKELNKDLEKHISQVEVLVEQKTQDIQSILSHIPQGIFTVVADCRIDPSYSRHLEDILETDLISNQSLARVILEKSDLNSDERAQVMEALRFSIGEPEIGFLMNCAHFPDELEYTTSTGKCKSLELNWSPVFDRNSVVSKVLVSIRDMTNLRDLTTQNSTQKEELASIAELIKIPNHKFYMFSEIFRQFHHENEKIIHSLKADDVQSLQTLNINLHTLKGMARTLNLSRLAGIIHETEQIHIQLIKKKITDQDLAKIIQTSGILLDQLEYYEHINSVVLGRSRLDAAMLAVNRQTIETLLQVWKPLRKDLAGPMLNPAFEQAMAGLEEICYESAKNVVSDLLEHSASIARSLGKENPRLVVTGPHVGFGLETRRLLESIFIHLLRNSLDHGIESREIRKDQQKSLQGLIEVQMIADHELTILYRDDGAGLDLGALKDKAESMGLIKADQELTDAGIADLIFSDGLSTTHAVTDISGRGIGMGAVRNFIEKASGSINLRLFHENKIQMRVPFQIEIRLPSRYYVTLSQPLSPDRSAISRAAV